MLLPSGLLQTRKSGGESFSAYLPEQEDAVTEGEAVRLFALMKSLDSGRKKEKAPRGKVFMLLVLERRTQAYVAREFECSPGLVSLRVRQIEKTMKRPLAELQRFASRLDEMDAADKDPRARTLYRKGLTDDTGNDEDES